MIISLVGYCVISLPLGCWLCFEKEMGVLGLFLAYYIALFFQNIAL